MISLCNMPGSFR